MVPELDLARVQKWVDDQNADMPPHVREVVRIEIDVSDRAITIFECRPLWHDQVDAEWSRQEVARMRYTKVQRVWTLYWPDRNSKFHYYEHLKPTPHIDRLIAAVDIDETCIFWG